MNNIRQLEVEYLRSSRTIELINITTEDREKNCFIFNHEGNHFRFFDSLTALIYFFEVGVEPKISFDSEADLDDFLRFCNI